ncbi:helix-turn-helix domain-containing protein [Amycolatopsis thermoflava]|uniref:helix-turn-helix domain-containing protein n=1 Tax=Amycolatopsis thermoflava TaxID=84480 RepID=UPI0036507CF9
MSGSVSLISRVSTAQVHPRDRVALWEEYNRTALVGLTCSPYSEHGLLAEEVNVRLGALHVAGITANEHVVERTPAVCRAMPKDSVFASLVLGRSAVFYHGDGCLTLDAGDLVVYGTHRSYLFGFAAPMRQLLVDIPAEVFAEHCLPGRLRGPLKFTPDSPGGGALHTLQRTLEGIVRQPDGVRDGADETVLNLLGVLAGAGRAAPPLVVARDYIERHLGEHDLTPVRVAAAVGVSVRHLGRLFAAEDLSAARYIQRRRLAAARRELLDPDGRHRTIAEVAHRWGFSSHAHFTRVFRAEFGHPPAALSRPSPPD